MKNTFAIIYADGKQHKVEQGAKLHLHRVLKDEGADITFEDVLLSVIDGKQVSPSSILVRGVVEKHFRGPKINIIKFKRRKHHLKRRGFKSHLTSVSIQKIETR